MYILSDDKVPDYAIELTRLVTLLAQDTHGVAPRHPVDVAHVQALLKLLAVDRNALDLDAAREALHDLLWPIICRPTTSNKYEHILEMYYPLTCLREDGNYKEPKNTTGLFAHMKYIMRMAWCYQGLKEAKSTEELLYK